MAVQRWTDEMLDELALSLVELRDNIDGLRITAQALLQVAAQQQRDTELAKQDMELAKQDIELHRQDIELAKQEMELFKQRQAESDQRFNILLEEIRYLRRASQGDEIDS
ncbi:hypothetical protein C7H19_13580 [Aphanothece hegewaldii CCALA 016]|uniref:Uncharacterized protein n=1 Tax=Aphanothece hegewaldii CCALA 016 TaxID=2107694 RepID=A0A2T1LWG0_9CHRO|nr:hypothetical protein [Aphanothece hegewaldii]PSF36234.1 hypothetical protein C7H19_13580 [Aphanothece hegewaldii CCALA 016]